MVITARLVKAFHKSSITLTQCGGNIWGYWRKDYVHQSVHDTPRTVWLKTMLNVSLGYIFIFVVSFSSSMTQFPGPCGPTGTGALVMSGVRSVGLWVRVRVSYGAG